MAGRGHKMPDLGNEQVETRNSAGAPTKYKQEYCDLIVQRANSREDTHVLDFCIYLGVVRSTISEWKKNHPRFSVAYKRARQIYERRFRKILEAQMVGKIQGSTSATIFYLKAQHAWTEDPFDEDSEDDNDFNIEVAK